MMAVYTEYRIAAFFFVTFIVLATFFMMNLFTAAAYLKYQEVEQGFEKQAIAMTERHLTKAFELLDFNRSDDLDREELLQVVAELRKAHLLPGIAQVRLPTSPCCDCCVAPRCAVDCELREYWWYARVRRGRAL
jgi:hypothetical protein